ncbi:hypothetical protein GCM10012280_15180 [Wenjunlia tyrosinilytica]|uniref:SMODS and SLOG-associating 2TM effector domain-containing protein n=2 Tax=Wenjunlia tyrosinilytica TaxID=1544741 RepID=A0A917ZLK6_9ACTN|nr:hypothetical protein GCM10012280_15180 [Wenjunlia tyrosinilytica]
MLGIAAAVLGTASSQVMSWNGMAGKALAFGAAVAAGLVPIAAKGAGPRRTRDWTRLRSVSEAVKKETYTFLAQAGPYRGPNAESELVARIDRLRASASDLTRYLAGIAPVRRAVPAVYDVDSYADLRVKAQLDGYYRPKAVEMARKVAVVQRIETVLGITGAILGAVSGVFGVEQASAWVAVAATVAAAVTAHAAAVKYGYQELEFTRTAEELDRLLLGRSTAGSPADEDAFVGQCEHVISIQNEAWMAAWTAE